MENLIKELDELKIEQRMVLKEKNLNVPKLNEINKRMFEIREILKQHKIKEKENNGLYIY